MRLQRYPNIFSPRNAILCIGLWIFAVAGLAAGGDTGEKAGTAAPQGTASIMVLGDSISAAYGIDTRASWVTLLERYLKNRDPAATGARYRVINASISGETTDGALARLPALLKKYHPAIVIIELGGNDGLLGHPIAHFRHNLERLAVLSQQSGARVLLVGMHIPPNYGTRYTRAFYESYGLTAQKLHIPLVPFLLQGVATKPALMQADGIHPKAEAQQTLLQNVLPYLNKLL